MNRIFQIALSLNLISAFAMAENPFADIPIPKIPVPEIIENTPLDPYTRVDLLENTPLDPRTHAKAAENTPLDPRTHPGGDRISHLDSEVLCVRQAQSLAERYRSDRQLHDYEKKYLRPFFRDLVDRVRVMTDVEINTYGGLPIPDAFGAGAKTFGHRIYVSSKVDRRLTRWLVLLAHEITHARQYEEDGSDLNRFCRRYAAGYKQVGFRYAPNPMEVEAQKVELEFAEWMAGEYLAIGAEVDPLEFPNPNPSINVPKKVLVPLFLPGFFQYSLVTIGNNTINPFHIEYAFGKESAKKATIEPDTSLSFWYRQPVGEPAAPFQVRSDVDPTEGVYFETSILDTNVWSAPRAALGRFYTIVSKSFRYQIRENRRRTAFAVGAKWIFEGGYFEKVGPFQWVEINPGGKLNFVEIESDTNWVELYDASRDIGVRLYPNSMYLHQPGSQRYQLFREGHF